ncbi:protein CBFA2T1-like [Acropora millepora]|uniref:protein CBFA2T1-like n=1 Tax=Acropora millepora TaxID=45264 RepID=UPI001CF54B12|nr:protein CBFA2T1-like [Acropora millepora]
MEKSATEMKETLCQLNKNIEELLQSFDEIVEQQAEQMASSQKVELRKVLKTEQNEANRECKRIKLEMEEIIKDIGRSTRKCVRDIRLQHSEKLRSVSQGKGGKQKNSSNRGSQSTPEIVNITDANLSVFPTCATCGKEEVWLCYCGECKVTRYCNESCQLRDWEKHMHICDGLRLN